LNKTAIFGLISICAISAMILCAGTDFAAPSRSILNITDIELDSAINQHPAFVLSCYTDWCDPCKRMDSSLAEITKYFQGNVSLFRMNMEYNNETKSEYNVTSYPTLLLFKNGTLVDKYVGYSSKEGIESMIVQSLSLPIPKSNATSKPVLKSNVTSETVPKSNITSRPAPKPPAEISFGDLIFPVKDDDVDSVIARYPALVLTCYADWCGFCKRLAPILNETAEDLRGKIAFGRIDMDENNITKRKYDVTGYPTLLIFKDGRYMDKIVGIREKDALKDEINLSLSGAKPSVAPEMNIPIPMVQVQEEYPEVTVNIKVDKNDSEEALRSVVINIFT
jgi:thioredoxin